MYFFMFPISSEIYPENIKNIDIWFTAKVFNNHEKYTETDIFTALFSGYFIGEATGIQAPPGEVAVHCEKQSLSSSHCPFTIWQASQVNVSLASFLPSNLPCGLVLCGGAHKQSIEKTQKEKRQPWMVWTMPCSRVRLYTEQHAHKIWTVLYCNGSACCIIHKYRGVLPGL